MRGLQRGLSLGITREFFFNGARIGMYGPALDMVRSARGRGGPDAPPPTPTERWQASLVCGALGAAIVNPLEVLKVRMQVQRTKPVRALAGARFRSCLWPLE